MLKKLLGLTPQPTEDGAFMPSKLALKLATSDTTDFDGTTYENPYQGTKKILMLCTEQRNMTMANGTQFSTGNHPVEMLLPMLHLKNSGFDVDIYTPTGLSVKIEMWAMPEKDENVQNIYSQYKSQFNNPKSLADFVQNEMNDSDDYVAVFIPGGHGAMLGLPDDNNVSQLIHWSYEKDLFMMAICHAPAALLSANLNTDNDFIYKGYDIAGFPDSVDKQTPMIGYMPGHMPWKYGEKLEKLGVKFINKKADKTCHIDRKLITGASPQAANNFGKLCAEELLQSMDKS